MLSPRKRFRFDSLASDRGALGLRHPGECAAESEIHIGIEGVAQVGDLPERWAHVPGNNPDNTGELVRGELEIIHPRRVGALATDAVLSFNPVNEGNEFVSLR